MPIYSTFLCHPIYTKPSLKVTSFKVVYNKYHIIRMAKKYNLPSFKDLDLSTCTVMAYTDMTFDLETIFNGIEIYDIDPPLTKKKKNVNKKEISAPYGAIVSIRKGIEFKGINLWKDKKFWCSKTCQLYETGGKIGGTKKVLSVETKVKKKGGINKFLYYCSECKQYYSIKELQKIVTFLNQITLLISIGSKMINVMIFKGDLKMAGCKSVNDAIEVVRIIWEEYIYPIKGSWSGKKQNFLFDVVMKNKGFHFGFNIDREKLNFLMNDESLKDKIYMSQYEPTSRPSVKIIMYAKDDGTMCNCLVYKCRGEKKCPTPYLKKKKNNYKKTKQSYVTFIVYNSSQTISSGRYKDMETIYDFFISTVMKNRKKLEQIID